MGNCPLQLALESTRIKAFLCEFCVSKRWDCDKTLVRVFVFVKDKNGVEKVKSAAERVLQEKGFLGEPIQA